MEDILNATLAGGVIMGMSADICPRPWIALIIGFVGGIVSVFGYHYFTPMLQKKLNLHDTCGVTNLHALPGLFGGICGIIMVAKMDAFDYGDDTEFKAAILGDRTAGELALK